MNVAGEFGCEQHARAALVDALRALGPAQLNAGRTGNLSMRWHRGGAQGLLISPSAISYAQMDADAIAWLPIEQIDDAAADDMRPAPLAQPAIWFGPHPPSSEWRMHRDLYAARADLGALVHVHSPYATALACSPRGQADGLPPFHYMVAAGGGENIRCAPYLPFGSQALADASIEAMRGRQACLLANHGMLVGGTGLAAAFDLAVEIESLARIYCKTLGLGEPVLLTREQMAQALQQFADYRANK